jgi:hypothetical protein
VLINSFELRNSEEWRGKEFVEIKSRNYESGGLTLWTAGEQDVRERFFVCLMPAFLRAEKASKPEEQGVSL